MPSPNPKDIIRSSQIYASEQPRRSWWHLLSTFAALAGLAVAIVLAPHWSLRLAGSVAFGFVMVRAFIIYHDVQHGTILRGSPVARWLAGVYGMLTLSPPSIWRRTHDHHHRNVGRILGASIGSFPIMTCAVWARSGFWARLGYVLQRHPLTIATGYLTVFLYGMCVRSFLVDPKKHADSGFAIGLHAALVVLLAIFAPGMLLFLVLVPLLVACALGSYLFYAQHNFPLAKMASGENWTYVAAALQSSSYIKMGPVMRWFTGNIGFHHVHHVNAKIPFYRLPEAMAGMAELQSPGTTSLRPLEVWKCLSLRLWDEAGNRLVRAPRWLARA
jgi:omega-6 fatty acid desaturase (delta-12 desaturase)